MCAAIILQQDGLKCVLDHIPSLIYLVYTWVTKNSSDFSAKPFSTEQKGFLETPYYVH